MNDLVENSVILLLGGLISFLITRWHGQSTKLAYDIRSEVVYSKTDELSKAGLSLNVGSHEVGVVVLHKVGLWNSGSRAIFQESFSESDPLRIEFEGAQQIILVKEAPTDSGYLGSCDTQGQALLIGTKGIDSGSGNYISLIEIRDDLFYPLPRLEGYVSGLSKQIIRTKLPGHVEYDAQRAWAMSLLTVGGTIISLVFYFFTDGKIGLGFPATIFGLGLLAGLLSSFDLDLRLKRRLIRSPSELSLMMSTGKTP